jgi:hypothetical protein
MCRDVVGCYHCDPAADNLFIPSATLAKGKRVVGASTSATSPMLRQRRRSIFKIKIATFRALKPQKLAISKLTSSGKPTLAQCLGNCSRATN